MTNEQIQSILEIWMKQGAEYEDVYFNSIDSSIRPYEICFSERVNKGKTIVASAHLSIYDILYNPSSNFWEVMFLDKNMRRKGNQFIGNVHIDINKTHRMKSRERYKLQSVLSKDPMQYVWDNSPLLDKFRE